MKKTYIEPKNTVVRLNTERMIANSPTGEVIVNKRTEDQITSENDFGARETVSAPDAWDEW